MIFSLLIIHNHDRMSSITQVLHTTIWQYFTSHLPDHFSRSPKIAKETVMADISDVGTSFFMMRRLFEILQDCFEILEKCVQILFPFLRLSSTY